MSGEKILIVDDRRENLLFLANSVLRPEGYRVVTAMDGKDGLDKAFAERPDLIIMDLKMPRMSGLEVLSALRKADCDIPIILTTFYGSEQAAIQAFRQGVKDYIIKPYEVTEMLDSVERALSEQRLRRETAGLKEGAEVTRVLEDRVRQLNSLCGIGKALCALQEPDEVLRVTVEASIYLTGAEAGQLFLSNAETQQLECRAVRGPSDSRARCLCQPGADQVTNEAFQTGQALVGEHAERAEAAGSVARLAVPLRSGEKVIGVLALDAKPERTMTENDRFQIGLLADFAVVALRNSLALDGLKATVASLSAGRSGPAAGGAPQVSAEALAEAQRLALDLRNLAVAAHGLANRLKG
jgi:CheY-like chemotaxis protein